MPIQNLVLHRVTLLYLLSYLGGVHKLRLQDKDRLGGPKISICFDVPKGSVYPKLNVSLRSELLSSRPGGTVGICPN